MKFTDTNSEWLRAEGGWYHDDGIDGFVLYVSRRTKTFYVEYTIH